MVQSTAQAAAQRIRAAIKAPDPVSAMGSDGFVFGDPTAMVDRVIVCRAPTAAVLKQIPAAGRTLLVSREDPFYWTSNRYGDSVFFWSAGLDEALKVNPVTEIKRQMMLDRSLVVYRLNAAWDAARPSSNADALARALGLQPVRGADPSTAYAPSPAANLDALARYARSRLKIKTIRVTGDPALPVKKVAVLNGLVSLPRLAAALKDPAVDGVILGETCEWEATPYFQDLIASGRKVGMVLIGYAASDQYGLPAMVDVIKAASPVPVSVIEDNVEPSWMV